MIGAWPGAATAAYVIDEAGKRVLVLEQDTLPPAIEAESVQAAFHDGVLKPTLPRGEKVRPKIILVETS